MNYFNTFRNIAFAFATLMLVKYYVFLMLAPLYRVQEFLRQKRFSSKISRYKPLVSIVVPAWNEEVGIGRTIESLINQTYRKIEIVVVNDGSTDKTEEKIKEYKSEKRLNYIYQKNGGKGKALNNGIKSSNGEIIVTMDADSVFDNDAIKNLVKYFADDSIDAVVGNVRVANAKNIITKIQQLEYLFGFYFKRAHAVMGAEYIYGGACAGFRRETVFEKLGLFDTTNKTEDIELSMRTRYYGLKSAYAEDVVCYTEGASDILGLINQRLRWKKGRFDTFLKYRSMIFSTKKVHNKPLTWFVLPFSMLAELQLLFEPIALTLLVAYSFVSGDYLSLALGTLFVLTIYIVNALFTKTERRFQLILSFVYTWPLFYFLVWIEFLALVKSLGLLIRGEDIVWQSWERKGVEA